LDLEKVRGLTDEEACVVVAIATKHSSRDEFPSLNGNPSYIKFSQKGMGALEGGESGPKYSPTMQQPS
jgi:hypothetical protein